MWPRSRCFFIHIRVNFSVVKQRIKNRKKDHYLQKLLNLEFENIENLSIAESETDSYTIFSSKDRETVIGDACKAVHFLVERDRFTRLPTRSTVSAQISKPLYMVWDYLKTLSLAKLVPTKDEKWQVF